MVKNSILVEASTINSVDLSSLDDLLCTSTKENENENSGKEVIFENLDGICKTILQDIAFYFSVKSKANQNWTPTVIQKEKVTHNIKKEKHLISAQKDELLLEIKIRLSVYKKNENTVLLDSTFYFSIASLITDKDEEPILLTKLIKKLGIELLELDENLNKTVLQYLNRKLALISIEVNNSDSKLSNELKTAWLGVYDKLTP